MVKHQTEILKAPASTKAFHLAAASFRPIYPVHVRFAPQATVMLHGREMTRWANNDRFLHCFGFAAIRYECVGHKSFM